MSDAIFVLGAGGFIGRHLAERLVREGTGVIAATRTPGRPLERVYEPARRVDVQSITADTSAARAALGWTPATTLDEGLRRTWQWFSTGA